VDNAISHLELTTVKRTKNNKENKLIKMLVLVLMEFVAALIVSDMPSTPAFACRI